MNSAGGYSSQFEWGERAQLAWDTLLMRPATGIPSWMVHVMDVPFIEAMTGRSPGDYVRDPDSVYLAFQQLAGVCFIDQYMPNNPLSMGEAGYESATPRKAATGADRIVLDGMAIDSPEAVVEHMEQVRFPRQAAEIAAFDPDDAERIEALIQSERAVQQRFGANLLKGPYNGFQRVPGFHYSDYGYEHYFTAYALYPEVMERDFAQQADLAVLTNRAAARAIHDGGLPPLIRLDQDMAGARGTMVDTRSLERIWFPHFARTIQPFLDADIRPIWHCDGNLMAMVPGLIEAGIGGFQGFQYECGMDYTRICGMTDRNGDGLLMIAGVSVSDTLPHGTPRDVADQLKWLVANGPSRGLLLGASSSVTPATDHDNIKALIEGLHYYREHGRP